MNFTNIMHIAFYTDQMDEMIDFYVNKLGGKVKASVKYEVYLNRDDRPVMQAIAKKTLDKLFNVYIELAPMQFIELFPADEKQKPHTEFNEHIGYSHYAFIVEDIYDTRKVLERNGVVFDTDISKGPSETYQMWTHDPDGNKFEIMQYTENSIQIISHT